MIFDNIRMKPKLLFLFIMTGIVPLGIVALIGSYSASNALLDLAFEQLGRPVHVMRAEHDINMWHFCLHRIFVFLRHAT